MAFGKLCLILTITLALAQQQLNSPIIYSKLTEAHVSYENFKILYYFDIDYMYQLSKNIENIISNAEKLCQQIPTTYCEVALQQVKKNRETIKNGINRIDNYGTKRVKRFCNWCGRGLRWATGVLDNAAAQVYDKKINELQNATITQHDLLRNQTYIMKTSMNISTMALEKLEQSIYNIDLEMMAKSKSLSTLQAAVKFSEIMQLIDMMNNEQQEIINQSKQTLTEAKLGKIPDIINEDQLNQDIKTIHNGLSSTQALPIDFKNEDSMKIFKYATTAAIKFDHKIMIEITVPITSREKYILYKTTAIPIKINNFTLIAKLQTRHFLMNRDETKFIPLRESDLETGLKIGESEMIYKPSAIVRLDKDNICEWKIMSEPSIEDVMKICEMKQIPNGNYVFEINQNDIYLISVYQEMKYIIDCNNQESVRKIVTQNELLKLKENCIVKTDSFTIQPHNSYTLNTSQVLKPELWTEVLPKNKLELWLGKNLTNIIESKPILVTEFEQLHELINDAEELAENANVDLKLENVHEATAKSSFIWIIIVAIILIILMIMAAGYIIYKIGPLKLLLGPEGAVLEQSAHVILQNIKATPGPMRKSRAYSSEEE